MSWAMIFSLGKSYHFSTFLLGDSLVTTTKVHDGHADLIADDHGGNSGPMIISWRIVGVRTELLLGVKILYAPAHELLQYIC